MPVQCENLQVAKRHYESDYIVVVKLVISKGWPFDSFAVVI